MASLSLLAKFHRFLPIRFGTTVRRDLEGRAGQIVEQHIEIDIERIAPVRTRCANRASLGASKRVMAGIELGRFGQAEIRA
jgi:hypothetical protein